MEILYVLIGGLLVVVGYCLAKPPQIIRKQEEQPQKAETQATVPPEEDTNVMPFEDQWGNMMNYDPRAGVKNGELE